MVVQVDPNVGMALEGVTEGVNDRAEGLAIELLEDLDKGGDDALKECSEGRKGEGIKEVGVGVGREGREVLPVLGRRCDSGSFFGVPELGDPLLPRGAPGEGCSVSGLVAERTSEVGVVIVLDGAFGQSVGFSAAGAGGGLLLAGSGRVTDTLTVETL